MKGSYDQRERARLEVQIAQLEREQERMQSLMRTGTALSPEWTQAAIDRVTAEISIAQAEHTILGGQKYRS